MYLFIFFPRFTVLVDWLFLKQSATTGGRLPPRRRSNQQPPSEASSEQAFTAAMPSTGQLSSNSGSHKRRGSGQTTDALLSAAGSTSSLSSLDATPHSHHGTEGGGVGTQDDLLQQDQRQHRVAARRGLGHGHATSKIKASGPILSQSHTPDMFGAAPLPAAAVHSHAVYSSTPTALPSEVPHAQSTSQKSGVSGEPSPMQSTQNISLKTSAAETNLPTHSHKQAPPTQQQAHSPSPTKREEEASPIPGSMPSGWIEVNLTINCCMCDLF